ncbi:hypothetical protein ACVBEQ_12440 [Nakamurella sp. GG22]
MNIDWNSLLLVAITTVVAAIAIVGVFSLGVVTLTGGNGSTTRTVGPAARFAGYACVGISGLLVLYGLYLIIPQFH